MSPGNNRRFNLPLPFGWFAVARSEELAAGVMFALVNGSQVIADGRYTNTKPGAVIDRTTLNCGPE